MTVRNDIGLKFLIRGKINILQKLRDGWNMSSKKHEYNHKKNVADFPFHLNLVFHDKLSDRFWQIEIVIFLDFFQA